jgi:hypothetical protein
MADWTSDFESRLAEGNAGYLEEQAFLDLIETCMSGARWTQALDLSMEALRQHPFSIELMCSQATVLLELDRAEEALLVLEQAAGMAPGETDVLFLQVETLIELGRAPRPNASSHPASNRGSRKTGPMPGTSRASSRSSATNGWKCTSAWKRPSDSIPVSRKPSKGCG